MTKFKKKLISCLILISMLLIILASSVYADVKSIANGQFVVEARSYIYVPVTFNYPTQSAKIIGTFRAAGGKDDIKVLVLDQNAMNLFASGNAVFTLYNSGKVGSGNIEVNLPGNGNYFIVFSNQFSLLTKKTVQAEIYLHTEP